MTAGQRLTRGWVRLYTAGLPAEMRCRRRAEIASDVWEHAAAARERCTGPLRTEAAIAWRCVRGVPADVAWRGALARRPGAGGRLASAVGWVVAVGAFAFLASVPVAAVVSYFVADDADLEWRRFALICAPIAAAQLGGVGVSVIRRRAGAVLAVCGVWGLVAAMWWAWPITVPLAMAATVGWWRLTARRIRLTVRG